MSRNKPTTIAMSS